MKPVHQFGSSAVGVTEANSSTTLVIKTREVVILTWMNTPHVASPTSDLGKVLVW